MRKPSFILLIFIITSCSSSRFVKPLERGQQAVNGELGGPLIDYNGVTIPIPFITATYGYGLDSGLTAFTTLNLTSALYGNLQVELGVVKQLLNQDGYFPAISVSPVLNFISHDAKAAKIFPQLDINLFWAYNQRGDFFYAGVDNWFELAGRKSYDRIQKSHWFLSPMAGHTFNGKKWNFNTEFKCIAPNITNEKLVVDYKTPLGSRGAFGIYFGICRKF